MTNKPKEFGRTLFDVISEHPKTTLFAFLALLSTMILVFIFLLFSEKSFKISSLEVSQKEEKSIEAVRKQDTTMFFNNPSNINTGTNNGVIGNNNRLYAKGAQRQLNPSSKTQLIELINTTINSNKKDKSCCINISSIPNNEAFTYSKEIQDFLVKKGYNAKSGIGTFQQSPPIEGAVIDFENECIDIKIGYMKK